MNRKQAEKLLGTIVWGSSFQATFRGRLERVEVQPGNTQASAFILVYEGRYDDTGQLVEPGKVLSCNVASLEVLPYGATRCRLDYLAAKAGELIVPSNMDHQEEIEHWKGSPFYINLNAEMWAAFRAEVQREKERFSSRDWPSEWMWESTVASKLLQWALERWDESRRAQSTTPEVGS